MTEIERQDLLRRYAAGEVTWHALQAQGFEDFVQVLGGLGDLGLRQPIATPDGPNGAARARGLAILRGALRARE